MVYHVDFTLKAMQLRLPLYIYVGDIEMNKNLKKV